MVHGANQLTLVEPLSAPTPSADQLQCVHWVIRHYAQLQGFRFVPLGVVFLVSSTWRAGFRGWLPQGVGSRAAFFIGLATAVATSFPIQRWYRRHFGRAGSPSTWGDASGLVLLTLGFMACASVGERVRAVSIPALFVGCALLSTLIASEGRRWHYGPVAACWIVFSMAGRIGLSSSIRDVLLDGFIGLSVIVCGLGDHRLLSKTIAKDVYAWTD
jgi:hypothetical protein